MLMIAQHLMLAWQPRNFQGIWTRIAKKPYIFVIFHGGPDRHPPPPSLWIRTSNTLVLKYCIFITSKRARLPSGTTGLQLGLSFRYFPYLVCMQAVKALMRLHASSGLPELWLLTNETVPKSGVLVHILSDWD